MPCRLRATPFDSSRFPYMVTIVPWKLQAEETSARFSKREAEARREIAVLEARLDAVGARESRRRDLLQLQASAYEDLQQALSDALPTPSDLVGGRPSPEPGDGNDGGV